MKTLTLSMVTDGITAAIEKNGRSYIDPRADAGNCKYVVKGEPSCIAGVVLHHVGVPVQALTLMDRHGQTIDAEDVLEDLKDAGFKLEPHALTALRVTQGHQDAGDTWGTAADEFRSWLAGL